MDEFYIGVLIGFIPAFLTLLIAEGFHYARDNRNLYLAKYEQALSSLTYDIEMFIDFTSKIQAALSVDADQISKTDLNRINDFVKEYKDRKRLEVSASVITAYDSSLEDLIDKQLDLDSKLAESMFNIIINLNSFGESGAGEFYNLKQEYINHSIKVIQTLRNQIHETSKNPLCKFITGKPKIHINK
jgi:hypothetical protein